jgi:hypothetical protein
MKVVVRKQKGSLKRLRGVYMETDSFAEFFLMFALGTIFDQDARHWSRFPMPRHPPPAQPPNRYLMPSLAWLRCIDTLSFCVLTKFAS